MSKGPLHAEIDLAPNMWGAEFVPQTSVLPLADLVITHGGNNTTTEALHFGKPTIVLPLFWDQPDNAQRMDELGLGVRLDTYGFTDGELHGAIDRLLGDGALRARLADGAARIQARQGLRAAADLIERTARAAPDRRHQAFVLLPTTQFRPWTVSRYLPRWAAGVSSTSPCSTRLRTVASATATSANICWSARARPSSSMVIGRLSISVASTCTSAAVRSVMAPFSPR